METIKLVKQICRNLHITPLYDSSKNQISITSYKHEDMDDKEINRVVGILSNNSISHEIISTPNCTIVKIGL